MMFALQMGYEEQNMDHNRKAEATGRQRWL